MSRLREKDKVWQIPLTLAALFVIPFETKQPEPVAMTVSVCSYNIAAYKRIIAKYRMPVIQ